MNWRRRPRSPEPPPPPGPEARDNSEEPGREPDSEPAGGTGRRRDREDLRAGQQDPDTSVQQLGRPQQQHRDLQRPGTPPTPATEPVPETSETASETAETGEPPVDAPASSAEAPPREADAAAVPRETSEAVEETTEEGSRPPAAGLEAAVEALDTLVPEKRTATVLSVANQKGGVGKTTTTVSLAAALAGEGAQVLVVDLDPQGNATTGLGLRAQEGAPSSYRVLIDEMPIEDAAEPTAVRGLHVVPSSLDLAGAEIELVSVFSRESRLRSALGAVRDLYDVILVDCPPSLGLLTINALVASDQVLVPIQCEYYALEGLGQLMRTLKLVSDGLNPELALGGVVLTMYDARTNLSEQVADEVRDYFGDLAYQTVVPRTVRLSEAPSYGQPITVFDPSSRGARAYVRLAREVARRLGLEVGEEEDYEDPLDALLGTTVEEERDETRQNDSQNERARKEDEHESDTRFDTTWGGFDRM